MENKNKKKSTGLLLSILGVISLILITAGVTYAFFSYAKQGVTENTIRTGTITFVYNEKTSTGLTIENALPKSDSVGMDENDDEGKYFEFSVTSKTPSTAYIDYIVTARMKAGSTLPQDQVKLYLTSTAADNEHSAAGYGSLTGNTAGSINTFDALGDVQDVSDVIDGSTIPSGTIEKVIYKGRIAAGKSSDYTRTFKLNMWLLGAETIPAHCTGYTGETAPADQAACTAASGTWVPEATDTTGLADYSAYEFVKLSAIPGTCSNTSYTTRATCVGASETWTYSTTELDFNTLKNAGDIIQSVPYYSGVEATPQTINPADYTRLKYVNQTTGKLITVAQGGSQPAATGWAESEQYYPLNGQTFTVTINVYAEGHTTYSVPASNPSNP